MASRRRTKPPARGKPLLVFTAAVLLGTVSGIAISALLAPAPQQEPIVPPERQATSGFLHEIDGRVTATGAILFFGLVSYLLHLREAMHWITEVTAPFKTCTGVVSWFHTLCSMEPKDLVILVFAIALILLPLVVLAIWTTTSVIRMTRRHASRQTIPVERKPLTSTVGKYLANWRR